ncbi:MAG: HNH endonuclease [Candidatus Krumholzibacteriia bacterium]
MARPRDLDDPRDGGATADGERFPADRVHAELVAALDRLGRAEGQVVLLFAEVHRRRLYRVLGYPSIHDYAERALGLSRSRTYRFLRLAEDLERLPRLRAAVAAGEIGWTKAREVARVASARNESRWIDEARRCGRRELIRRVDESLERRRHERGRVPDVSRSHDPLADRAPGPVPTAPTTLVPMWVPTPVPEPVSAPTTLPLAEAPSRPPPAADGPTTVCFRLDSLQRARYEALLERIRLTRTLPASASREELLLAAFAALAAGESPPATSARSSRPTAEADSPLTDGLTTDGLTTDGPPAPETPSSWRRRHSTTAYQIVVYQCETCAAAVVRTSAGERVLAPAAAEAVNCDARVQRGTAPNRARVSPAARRRVLARDGYRCRACSRTRFLEVHHVEPRGRGGSNRPANLVTLCSGCHALVHLRGRVWLRARLQAGPGEVGTVATGGAPAESFQPP